MAVSAAGNTSGDYMPLDHLVYAVPRLDEAVADFERQLGVGPRFGGRHEGLGTHNAILVIDERAYVELVAVDPDRPAPSAPRPFGLDELEHARLVTWAARTEAIEEAAQLSRQRGFDPGMILEVSRARPDGELLRWKLTLRREPAGDGLIPFMIDWAEAQHPASLGTRECRLESFTAEHPQPGPVRDALSALGVALDVRRGEEPRLTAVVAGPVGRIVLDSGSAAQLT